ncbi:MAG: hypothetical protein U9O20_03645 [Patescibacteria group bacterium]|nr:hypothetical protein [Patescibacteria group bacterium]
MTNLKRSKENPVLIGESHNPWEARGAFNGCPVKDSKGIHLLYRAMSSPVLRGGSVMEVSTIGYAFGKDGLHFKDKKQLIQPQFDWEQFGCEDPRITKLGSKYYIFYTALSKFPFSPEGISIGVAITKDFNKIENKFHVTPFNSKAMALFPEKIGGKFYAILTANTDLPPAKIALVSFDNEGQIWDQNRWNDWYADLNAHTLPLQRGIEDHVEVGAPPVKTKKGWLLVYSYIKNYLNERRSFGVEAVLLDLKDPGRIIGRTEFPILVPQEEYELYGIVPNIVFPSGVFLQKNTLHIYYGGADTVCCQATCDLDGLLDEMLNGDSCKRLCQRLKKKPILSPLMKNDWESKAVFNPGILREKGVTHIIYRAMSRDDISVMGYASTKDGVNIETRLADPVYVPREDFEVKQAPGNTGCEDPRLTRIGNKIYMCYTALNGQNLPRVAITSIKASDFFAKKWKWSAPKLISPPGVDDKDAIVFPEKIKGKYVILHRLQHSIDVSYFDNLSFENGEMLQEIPIMFARKGMWDDKKVGINTVPLKTRKGWMFIYHGVSNDNNSYRLGATLLDLKDPEKVLARTRLPLCEPELKFEKEGIVPNVVFPCGGVLIGNDYYIYYGGADTVIGVAKIDLKGLLKRLS